MKLNRLVYLLLLTLIVSRGYSQQADTVNSKNQFSKFNIDHKSPIKFVDGFISYNFDFQSLIDTPFIGSNISQHYALAGLNLQVANIIPVRINYLARYSNSTYFKKINDVQVVFDGLNFKNNLNSKLRERLLKLNPRIKDSLTELCYKLKLRESDSLSNWLRNPKQVQKFADFQEIIQVPDIVRNYNLPDSISKAKTDSILNVAQKFVKLYLGKKSEYDTLKGKIDSLKNEIDKSISSIEKYKKLINSNPNNIEDLNILKQQLDSFGVNDPILRKYKWLMGVKQLALGKNVINYSELTAKNISSTGLNFEYNSWYYLAVAAGTIDYKYRDFLVKPVSKPHQFFYMGRFGIGNIKKNVLIVSLFKGQRQAFVQNSSASNPASVNINGVSIESRLTFNRNSHLEAEIAQSQIPSYSYSQIKSKKIIDFSDLTNKAFSVKMNYFLPHLQTRIDGMYKYAGVNYRSFSSFKTNSSLRSWHVKLDKYFLNRSLKITASAKTNEFTNPIITQNYKSSTIFKSFNATFHRRRAPSIGIAYAPVSQLTYLNNILSESKFYSLTSNLNYAYRLKDCQAITTVVYSRFFNKSQDSGFVFYNSNNVLISQTFSTAKFTEGFGAALTKHNNNELLVVQGSLSYNIKNCGSVGAGIKVNNFSKLGTFWKSQLAIKNFGVLNFAYDQGYLPGNNYNLIRNDNMSLGFVKILR